MNQQSMSIPEDKKEKENVAKNVSENKAVVKLSPIQAIVKNAQASFEKSNEYNMNFSREANFALQILGQNTYLQKATPETIKNAIINVSLTGLSLNPALKYAYLVPRNSKDGLNCVLDISYIGMIKLLTDAGAVKNIDCDIIYENDKYDFRKGSDPYLKHSQTLTDRGEMIAVYAIAYFRDGGSQFLILNKEDVEKVRATSESWKNEQGRKYSPWETFTAEMWKKTALKRLFKILPKTDFSEQLISAISHEHNNEIADIETVDEHAHIFDDAEVIPDNKD